MKASQLGVNLSITGRPFWFDSLGESLGQAVLVR